MKESVDSTGGRRENDLQISKFYKGVLDNVLSELAIVEVQLDKHYKAGND